MRKGALFSAWSETGAQPLLPLPSACLRGHKKGEKVVFVQRGGRNVISALRAVLERITTLARAFLTINISAVRSIALKAELLGSLIPPNNRMLPGDF